LLQEKVVGVFVCVFVLPLHGDQMIELMNQFNVSPDHFIKD
jgi:hypothetical protein